MRVKIFYSVVQTKVIDIDEKFEKLRSDCPFPEEHDLVEEVGRIAYKNLPDDAEIYGVYTDDKDDVCLYEE